MELKENSIIGSKYQLLRLIGRGQHTEVWLAKDQWTMDEVAIKVYATNDDMEASGIRNYADAYDVSHPNLLKPERVDTWDRFALMTYCPKGSCAMLMGQATEEQINKLLHDVGSALAYLHSKNLTHGNLKPTNVLIGENGDFLLADMVMNRQVYGMLSGGDKSAKSADIRSLGEMCNQMAQYGVSVSMQEMINQMMQTNDENGVTAEMLVKWCTSHKNTSAGVAGIIDTLKENKKEEYQEKNDESDSTIEEEEESFVDEDGDIFDKDGNYCGKIKERENVKRESEDVKKEDVKKEDVKKEEEVRREEELRQKREQESAKQPKKKSKNTLVRFILTLIGVLIVAYIVAWLDTNYGKDESYNTDEEEIEPLPDDGCEYEYVPDSVIISEKDGVITFQIDSAVTFKMIKVEGGTFMMGSENETNKEMPVHEVTLEDYYIGETEVTQALWKLVMGENPSYTVGDNNPVDNVTWYECLDFFNKLSDMTGRVFSFPTEAKWEYAARGGAKSRATVYSGSSEIGKVAWYHDNTAYETHPVGKKKPNELGLYDMSGNVCEWCYDIEKPYRTDGKGYSSRIEGNEKRAVRGGCYCYKEEQCSCTLRGWFNPAESTNVIGVRMVLLK